MGEGKAKKERRQRRKFTDDYKAATEKLVLSGRKTAGQVARDLGLKETATPPTTSDEAGLGNVTAPLCPWGRRRAQGDTLAERREGLARSTDR
jgi:hypothetical protein